MYRRVIVYGNATEHLHADDCIDEEEHHDQQRDVWQRLEGGKTVSHYYLSKVNIKVNAVYLKKLFFVGLTDMKSSKGSVKF